MFLNKREIWMQRHVTKGDNMNTQEEEGYVQDNKRGLEQILLSQPKEGIDPADTLILNF